MPTYEYACKKCGERLEVVQSFTDDALTKHEQCGGQLKKVFGNVGIVFKGSGFYKTDSRPADKKSSTTSSSSSESTKSESESSSSTEATKSDTKPAADKPAEKKESPKSTPSTAAAS